MGKHISAVSSGSVAKSRPTLTLMNSELSIIPDSKELVRQSTDIASLCKQIVVASAVSIQGRKYVRVEGWQAIATAHGCVASARDVRKVEGGMVATGEIRRMQDGQLIATAEGFVGEDEPTWFGGKQGNRVLPRRAEYAIRAMAQTRAISRACRGCFAHVVVLMDAGLSTTPAEEVPEGGFEDHHDSRPAEPTPKPAPAPISDEQAKIGNVAKLRGILMTNRPEGITVEDYEKSFCMVIAAQIEGKPERVKLEDFSLDELRGIVWKQRAETISHLNELAKTQAAQA